MGVRASGVQPFQMQLTRRVLHFSSRSTFVTSFARFLGLSRVAGVLSARAALACFTIDASAAMLLMSAKVHERSLVAAVGCSVPFLTFMSMLVGLPLGQAQSVMDAAGHVKGSALVAVAQIASHQQGASCLEGARLQSPGP